MSESFMSVKEAEALADMDMGLEETGFVKASSVKIPDALLNRWETGCGPFDQAFGKIVPGATYIFSGVRGTGKTTFLTQLGQRIHDYHGGDKIVGFTSGEEPIGQLRMNFKRTNVNDVLIANMTFVEDICEVMDDFDLLFIDSFQSLRSRYPMGPNKVARYAQNRLIAQAKKSECTVIFIGHANKQGEIKGNTSLPHSVDVEMSIERRSTDVRAIVVDKNRFGPIGEIGLAMTDVGLDLDNEVDLTDDEETDGESSGGNRAQKKREDTELLIEFLSDQGEIAHRDLYASIELSATRITSLLKELQDKGLVEKEGTRKHNMMYRWIGE